MAGSFSLYVLAGPTPDDVDIQTMLGEAINRYLTKITKSCSSLLYLIFRANISSFNLSSRPPFLAVGSERFSEKKLGQV